MPVAGQRFAGLVTVARVEGMGRVMALGVAQARSAAVYDLVHRVAVRPAGPAAAGPHGAVTVRPHGAVTVLPEERRRREATALRQRNIDKLGRVLYNEGRGEGREAMVAVGWTLRNRMLRNGVGEIDQVWQGYAHGANPAVKPGDRAALDLARQIAADILDGKIADPTQGATHYYSPQQMPKEHRVAGPDAVAGGLEDVPGVVDTDAPGQPHARNYRPSWSSVFERVSTPNFPEKNFKFYRQNDGKKVK